MTPHSDLQAQLDEHFLRCYTDFPYYAEKNLRIRTKEGTLVPFVLNEVQMVLEEIENHIVSEGRLIRMYVLKARQEGVSTKTTGKFFWKVTTRKNRSAVIVTHEPPATRNLFDMQKRFYKNLQPEFQPKTKYNNVKVLQFDNDDGTGLDSSIGVSTAGVKDFGSSQTINYLHISELSKWPRENEEDLLISLFQCVPREPDTAVVIESTAKGIGGEFHKGYFSSRFVYEVYLKDGEPAWKVHVNKDADPSNIYSSIFIPWFVFKKYRLKAPADFKPTIEEQQWIKLYGLDYDQLNWYRSILANECKGDKNKRSQEYPMTAREAFIGSGKPAFNMEKVMEAIQSAPPPIITYTYNHSLKKVVEDAEGDLKLWEQPKRGIAYLISADVAEGLEHGDFDSAKVWNHMTKEQVAEYHGHMSPFRFANFLYFLGMMYNTAWIVPERNNHGISVVEKLLELEYPHLYVEMVPDPPHKHRRRFGWLTSTKTRNLIVDLLIDDMYEGSSGIKDKETFEEMLNFKVQSDGKMEADPGTFDDRVMSAAIGRYTMGTLKYAMSLSQYYSGNNSSTLGSPLVQQRPSAIAYT